MPPATTPEAVRLAVDIGGTFTDVVLETPDARFSRQGADHARRARGRRARRHAAGPEAGEDASPAEVGLIVHGTTLATNAIIERKGAQTALVTTEGFRDSIEMALGEPLRAVRHLHREARAAGAARPCASPCPSASTPTAACSWRSTRRRCAALAETLKARGRRGGRRRLPAQLRQSGARAARRRDPGRSSCPACAISLSCEVCPEIREYERFSTTCANAYVQPLMARYLEQPASRARGGRASPARCC